MLTDREIIDLFFARSERAIETTAKKYGQLCSRIARNILKNASDAEESVSDAYLALWNTIPPQRPDPLRAYLCRIVRNLSLTRFHQNTAKKRDSSYDVALDELEECLAAPGGVEDALSARDLTELLNRFLASLDRDSRRLFVRRYWFGDDVRVIALAMGLRPNTVSARLRRLREKLKKELAKEGIPV